jgi:hypothetical protein
MFVTQRDLMPVHNKLDLILAMQRRLLGMESDMTFDISRITNAVSRANDTEDKALALLTDAIQHMRDAAAQSDPSAAINALADSLDQHSSALAAKVAEGDGPAASSAPAAPASSPTTDPAASTPADNTPPASPPDNQGS